MSLTTTLVEHAKVSYREATPSGGRRSSGLAHHPGHTPEEIARGLRAEEDVAEIAALCVELAAAGMIERGWPQ